MREITNRDLTSFHDIKKDPDTLPLLSRVFETLLIFYGAFFASTMASVIPKKSYLAIASHMCKLTGTKIASKWWRGLSQRHSHLINNRDAIHKLPSLVLPQDIYKMDDVWVCDKEIDLRTASMAVKMDWLRVFLKDTYSHRLRMLVVPYQEGMEAFVAECMVNSVLVFHESRAEDTQETDVESIEDTKADTEEDAHTPSSPSRSATPEAEEPESPEAEEPESPDTEETVAESSRLASPESADNEETAEEVRSVSPESADTEDTVAEVPQTQLVLANQDVDVLDVCKGFTDKARAYPSTDVLKLLEHTLEERNKLIMRVVTMEMELQALRRVAD
ncbi:hypothetical protein CJU89_1196 [Yarrowia sp. B02]|nr:hypothetical protein CJU89_1196 [Yarrowia sp. B02]